MKLRKNTMPKSIFNLDRHAAWGMSKLHDSLYTQERIEFTEKLLNAFQNLSSIKLMCGVCHTKPDDTDNTLYINQHGVCKDCMDSDANYSDGRDLMDAQDQMAEMERTVKI